MSGIGPWINISSRDPQLMKAPSPIVISDAGRSIVWSDEQLLKAQLPSFVSVGGRTIVSSDEQV